MRVALLGSLALVLLVGSMDQRARAADDDDDAAFDTKIMRNILRSLGLRRSDDTGIEYRERSPLVIPPSRNLPPPETATLPPPGLAWPDDPDAKRARQAKAASKGPLGNPEPADRGRPLLPSEYSRNTPASRDSRPDGKAHPDPMRPMSPAELDAKSLWGGIFQKKEEYATFSGEPPRTSLVEPPTGYRTPSPNQPYGVGKQKWDYKPVDRVEVVR